MKKQPTVSPYRQGADARYTGKPLTACPYVFHSTEGKEWREGWQAIEKSMNREPDSEGGETD